MAIGLKMAGFWLSICKGCHRLKALMIISSVWRFGAVYTGFVRKYPDSVPLSLFIQMHL